MKCSRLSLCDRLWCCRQKRGSGWQCQNDWRKLASVIILSQYSYKVAAENWHQLLNQSIKWTTCHVRQYYYTENQQEKYRYLSMNSVHKQIYSRYRTRFVQICYITSYITDIDQYFPEFYYWIDTLIYEHVLFFLFGSFSCQFDVGLTC